MNIEMIESELLRKGLATRADLHRKELTPEEWEGICKVPLLKDWHCIANSRMVDRVLAEIEAARKADANAKDKARRNRAESLHKVEMQQHAHLAEQINEAVDTFAAAYPQYAPVRQNFEAMMAKLRELGTYADDLSGLVRAYEELCAAGKLHINWEGKIITGHALANHPQLDKILAPVRAKDRIEQLSADEFRKMNDQIDRDNGVKPPRSARALDDMDKLFEPWWSANPGYQFDNQMRADVRDMIFAFLDSEEIPWSVSAVQYSAEHLRKTGKLFRHSDSPAGTEGEFSYKGSRWVVYPSKNNPVLNPPPQKIELVDKLKRITLRDLRNYSAAEYAAALRDPSLAQQIEALLVNQ